MTAFSTAMLSIFADANMAVDAVWKAGGTGPDVACRAIRRAPDEVTDFGAGRFRSATTVADVLVSAIATPAAGDTLTIGAEVFRVQGEPLRDNDRLVWSLDLVPA